MTPYIVIVAILFAISFSLMIFFAKSIWLKLSTVAILFVISNQIYFGFESMKGWPTEEKLQGSGQLLWAIVNEPNGSDAGAIYMWVYLPEDDSTWYNKYVKYHTNDASPRAVKLPYNKNTAEQINKAKKAMEEGYMIEVDFGENKVNDGSTDGSSDNSNNEPSQGNLDASSGVNDTTDNLDENMPRLKLVDPRDILRKGQQ
jgi:hypothetical protein